MNFNVLTSHRIFTINDVYMNIDVSLIVRVHTHHLQCVDIFKELYNYKTPPPIKWAGVFYSKLRVLSS